MKPPTIADSNGYLVRRARSADLAELPGVERAAWALFAPWASKLGLSADAQVNSLESFRRGFESGWLWTAHTAEDKVIGFALALELPLDVHLEELDVLPEHARRGIGTRLAESVCAAARIEGFSGVTLRTFRDVPWNAPFYSRLGFRELSADEEPPELVRMIARERARGLRTELRVSMRKAIV